MLHLLSMALLVGPRLRLVGLVPLRSAWRQASRVAAKRRELASAKCRPACGSCCCFPNGGEGSSDRIVNLEQWGLIQQWRGSPHLRMWTGRVRPRLYQTSYLCCCNDDARCACQTFGFSSRIACCAGADMVRTGAILLANGTALCTSEDILYRCAFSLYTLYSVGVVAFPWPTGELLMLHGGIRIDAAACNCGFLSTKSAICRRTTRPSWSLCCCTWSTIAKGSLLWHRAGRAIARTRASQQELLLHQA